MSAPFHVQGRLIERRGALIVRDETRLEDVGSRDEAFRIARMLTGEGFTVWVWAIDDGAAAEWKLLDRIEPPPSSAERRRPATRVVARRGGMTPA
jgi:hypothetical protein